MGRTITLSLAVLMTPVIVFVNPVSKAQQADFRRTQDAAMTAAAGPEFQRTGVATAGPVARPLNHPQSSGPFPPQPYQSARSELQPAAQTPSRVVHTGQPQVADVAEADQASQPGQFDTRGHSLGAQEPDLGAYSPQLEARSRRIFPSVGQEAERQQWMADQEQRAIANEINRTKPLLYPVSGR
jgi:hypothetical protein